MNTRMNTRPRIILLIVCLFIVSFLYTPGSSASGATFYVDYVSGYDSNNGTSMSTPWKHCPGDSNATGTPGSITLSAGDTVYFRGGVKYRGTISLKWSGGSLESPITYKGSGWGSEKAIITGAEEFSQSWTKCSAARDCWNNPNWENIYYTTIPEGKTFLNRLLQNDEFLWFAQDPNPSTKLFWATLSEWKVAILGNLTRTSIKDTSYFTQSDSTYWDGAYIAGWFYGNTTKIRAVTGFNTSTDTVSFADARADPYSDRNSYYTVLNHPALIDSPGEYAFRPDENRVYIWLNDSSDPNSASLEISTRLKAFSGANKSYIVIDGFKITGTLGDISTDTGGIVEVVCDRGISTGNKITNCEVCYLSGYSGEKALHLRPSSGATGEISNNNIHDLFKNRGILFNGGSSSNISNNTVERIGHTAIWINNSTNVSVFGNTVSQVKGVHGNGISVYSCTGAVVERNHVSDTSSLFAFESGSNYTVKNNIFDGYGYGTINEWYGMSGYVRFLNNTMVNGASHNIFRLASGASEYTSKNNVIDGGGIGNNCSNNVYTGLAWNQDERYGWALSTGAFIETDLSVLFVDPASKDYTPLSTGPLISGGTDVSEYGVTADCLLVSDSWNIGACTKAGELPSRRTIRIE